MFKRKPNDEDKCVQAPLEPGVDHYLQRSFIVMVASPPLTGIYVPVPSFFVFKIDPNFNARAPLPDLDTQAAHSIYLARCGIKGLVVLGSTGEAVHLSNTERVCILLHVKQELEKAGFPNYPIIAGTATQISRKWCN